MTEKRKSSWKCLTVAFLVCNILSAAVVSSTVFSLAVVGALFASFDTNAGSVIAVSGFQAVFSFIEFLISIVAAAHCCCCSQLNTGNQQRVIFINTSQSGMINNMPNTQIPTGNQQGYHQMWMPQMQGYYVQQPANMAYNQQHADHSNGNQMPIQGYYGQQPANIPNYQQQAGHLQGNQIPVQGYYMQQPQSFEMANQQLNINNEQFLHPTAPAVDTNQPFPLTENSVRSEI
ncbi:uncharacterized protein LOC143078251 [Mytilus galloprovincialis]|uniref:uncharacterized protein LOC143078251 n=1 Tax=Mytilus galloprovincialis TaxID=29158 RepID=UPI003F7BF98D